MQKHHMLEKHRGNMWALAAYTPQADKHAHESHVTELMELGFPFRRSNNFAVSRSDRSDRVVTAVTA